MADNGIQVVIVTYKSAKDIKNCLMSIRDSRQSKHSIDIHVIDNNSHDNVKRKIQSLNMPNIRLTMNQRNLGFAAAANQGIAQGNSTYILLLNPDAVLSRRLIEKGIAYLETHKEVGVIGPRVLDLDGSLQGSARSFPNALTAFFGRNSILTKLFPNNSISKKNIVNTEPIHGKWATVDWVSGACMITRREAIKEVGAFDERFFMYWEDADLCRRLGAAGWKTVYLETITAIHHIGKSSSQRLLRSILEFHKSAYLLFKKYDNLKNPIIDVLVATGLSARALMSVFLHLFRIYSRWLKKKQDDESDMNVKLIIEEEP